MVPIRKGDGTTVVPDGIGQVRTGDGRILFEGDAIPDSVVDNMDLYWQIDEGSGSDLEDSLGDVSATISGAEWSSDADFDNYLVFDGVDDELQSDEEFFINQSQSSHGFWLRADIDENGDYFYTDSLGNRPDDGYEGIQGDTNKIGLNFRNGGSSEANLEADIVVGEWYFIGITLDGDNADLYVFDDDGNLHDSGSTSSSGRGSESDSHFSMFGEHVRDFAEGDLESFMAGTDVLSQSDWGDIVDDTKPGA